MFCFQKNMFKNEVSFCFLFQTENNIIFACFKQKLSSFLTCFSENKQGFFLPLDLIIVRYFGWKQDTKST